MTLVYYTYVTTNTIVSHAFFFFYFCVLMIKKNEGFGLMLEVFKFMHFRRTLFGVQRTPADNTREPGGKRTAPCENPGANAILIAL